jgi:hypothetical protein
MRDMENAVVGNGDPVRITAQIIQCLLRSAKGLFGIHHPGGVFHGYKIVEEGSL